MYPNSRLQQLEAGARQAEAREREAAEHAEAQQFAALQQMYGFSDKVRTALRL